MTKSSKCPLCNLDPEEIRYRDGLITIADTKDKKGHRERIMVLSNRHVEVVPRWLEEHALSRLEEVGRLVFNYAYKFAVLSPIHGSIRYHWHYVASAMDPEAEDFEQMMGTPWIKVVDVRGWRDGEINPPASPGRCSQAP